MMSGQRRFSVSDFPDNASRFAAYEDECDRLEQQLTAEREAREKADYHLHTALCDASTWKQLAESAEQKLRDAQEQEPVGYRYKASGASNGYAMRSDLSQADAIALNAEPLYAAPIPPADVAELQREIEQLIRRDSEQIDRIASLTRKLAEYQAIWSKVFRMQYNCCSAQQMADFMGDYCQSTEWNSKELTKLLEEAKRQAVPEGWKLVPIELLQRVDDSLGSFCSDHGWSQEDMNVWDSVSAMLATVPLATPEERIEEGRI